MAAIEGAIKQERFYKPTAVPSSMEAVIRCCVTGEKDKLMELWRPSMRAAASGFGREDTCHPLLHASHRLHVDIVKFFLNEGLNPRQRGTVHPYTGDCMTVAELQAISPMELITKMLFMNPRRSKKREAILAVKEALDGAHAAMKVREEAASAASVPAASPQPSGAGQALFTPLAAGAWEGGRSTGGTTIEPSPSHSRGEEGEGEGEGEGEETEEETPAPPPVAPTPAAVARPLPVPTQPGKAAPTRPRVEETGGKPPRGGRGTRLDLDGTGGRTAKRRRVARTPVAQPFPQAQAEKGEGEGEGEAAEEEEAEAWVAPDALRPIGPPHLEGALEAAMLAAVQAALTPSGEGEEEGELLTGFLLPTHAHAAAAPELLDASTPVALARMLHGAGRTLPYTFAAIGAPDGVLAVPTSLPGPAPGALMAGIVGGRPTIVPIPTSVHAYASVSDLARAANDALSEGRLDRAAAVAAGLSGGLLGLPRTDARAPTSSSRISPHLRVWEEDVAWGEEAGALLGSTPIAYASHGYRQHREAVGLHPVSAVLLLPALTASASCLAPGTDALVATAAKSARGALRAFVQGGQPSVGALTAAALRAAGSPPAAAILAAVSSEASAAPARAGFASVLSGLRGVVGSLVLRPGASIPVLLVLPRPVATGQAVASLASSLASSLVQEQAAAVDGMSAAPGMAQRCSMLAMGGGALLRPLLAAESSRLWVAALAAGLSSRPLVSAAGQPFAASLAGVHVVTSGEGEAALPLEYALVAVRLHHRSY